MPAIEQSASKIAQLHISKLKTYIGNARTHSKKQVQQIARSIEAFGFNNPILVDADNQVIAGHGRLLAAKQLNLKEVPVIHIEHLSDADKRAYIIADNKLAEKAGWDEAILKIELQNILDVDTGFDLTITGFETPELDLIIHDLPDKGKADEADVLPADASVTKRVGRGDLWQLGEHFLYCGDSTKSASFSTLMQNEKANMLFADPPYNVAVNGHVGGLGKTKHDEFAYASGEMSSGEFQRFLEQVFQHAIEHSCSGSLHYICMDWRHIHDLLYIGHKIYDETKNICIWNKQLGGMGSLYRSQHELVTVFKHGKEPHTNNIELGRHGRYRTNVWDYPGVHASNHHRHELKLHPTVKPVSMIADAILDCTHVGGVVLDCFGGSGSTLLAAERTRRKARLIEYEPKYCDVTIHRFMELTDKEPKRLIKGDDNV